MSKQYVSHCYARNNCKHIDDKDKEIERLAARCAEIEGVEETLIEHRSQLCESLCEVDPTESHAATHHALCRNLTAALAASQGGGG